MFTRAICGQFVGRQLDCGRRQTQVDDVFIRRTLSDEATSSDLDIRRRELTDAAVTTAQNERSEQVHLLGAEWLPHK